ncbi:MAG TPA: T9SS type A sorting domain-containing protein [Flavobacterium sp.]|jgi:hypothetical protein
MRHIYLLLLAFVPMISYSQAAGCTDPLSSNYNPLATENDGSCVYQNATIMPLGSVNLADAIRETSGLIRWGTGMLTHNDDTDTKLYVLDSLTGAITTTHQLQGVTNVDWEEITQDADFIYVGDFGNNAQGNRSNLRILRIAKETFPGANVEIDTISFSFEDQADFTPHSANNTDFDCEAFVASSQYIYLFTKQWVSHATAIYRLPKVPGTHIADAIGAWNINGLVTGATLVENRRILVLSGYDNLLRPFLYLLYDYYGDSFFSGNKRKVTIPMQFHQMEGITTTDGLRYHLSNERFSQAFLNVPAKLHAFDLNPFLNFYINGQNLNTNNELADRDFVVFPNPVDQTLTVRVRSELVGSRYIFFDQSGRMVLQGNLEALFSRIDVSDLSDGIYNLQIGDLRKNNIKVAIK